MIDRFADLVPTVDRAALERIEADVRFAYGTSFVYVRLAREQPAEAMNARLAKVRTDVPVAEQIDGSGMSRATLYRLWRFKKQNGGAL
jgi:hypothetical protein